MATTDFPVYDNSPKGVYNNGTKEGILKARVENGNLIKIPASAFRRVTSVGGNGTTNSTAASLYNTDGTSFAVNLTGVTAIGDTSMVTLNFKGTYCALRYREDFGASYNISVVIDGVAYDFPKAQKPDGNISYGTYEQTFVVDDSLDEGDHIITICRHYNPLSSASFVIHGLTVDSKNWYTPLPTIDQVYSYGVLTTSAANIPNTDTNTSFGAKAVKKIRYVNTSGSPATVTLNHATNLYHSKVLAAGEEDEISLSTSGFKIAELQHLASVGSAIRYYCIGII